MLVAGIILLLVEFFVLPGFGIAGISGIVLILGGLFGMLLTNAPDQLPWPRGPEDWGTLNDGVLGLGLGVGGFIVLAAVLSRYLPRLQFMSGLILTPTPMTADRVAAGPSMTGPPAAGERGIGPGDVGQTLTTLRPAGKAKFADAVVDVVAMAEFLDEAIDVEIVEIRGNRVVVKKAERA